MRTNRAWLLIALWPLATVASSVVPHTLEDRLRAADRVVVAQVLSQRVEADPQNPRRMKTLTEVLVGEELKGMGEQRLTVVQIGGALNGYELHIPGDAQFTVGETAVLFLKCKGPRCNLVALGEGKLALEATGEVTVNDLITRTRSKQRLSELSSRLTKAAKAQVAEQTR